jgi:cation:H+ antiporter
MESLPLALLIGIFAGAAAVIWLAGIQLSKQTDVLDDRLHLGSALGGLILLAIATNLPEIAITVSAAASNNIGVAVGNILGGIAIQTVVLVILDVFGTKGSEPLSYKAASLTLVIEAVIVIAVLGVVIAGSQMPNDLVAFHLAPAAVLITTIWFLGLFLVQRSQKALPWHEQGDAPGGRTNLKGTQKYRPRRTRI